MSDILNRILAVKAAEINAARIECPDVAMRARDYMVAVKSLGDLQTGHGRAAEGCRTYQQARDLIAAVKVRGRLTGLDMSDIVSDLGQRELAFCARTGQNTKSECFSRLAWPPFPPARAFSSTPTRC